MKMKFEEELAGKAKEAEKIVLSYLPDDVKLCGTLTSAMNYSVGSGGKRLRPLILLHVYDVLSAAYAGATGRKCAECFAAALEMIHSYSLVHDDLPAMDNDTLRRNNPTVWVKYGEAMAVLAGDALLNYAYETAAGSFDMVDDALHYQLIAKALKYLGSKSGIYGMVGGQCVDVESEKKQIPLDKDALLYVHENKTGALLQASFVIGGILAGADDEELALLSDAALNTGIAFQIRDDILDVEGDEQILGKNIGSDEESGKSTYVSLFGLENAKKDATAYSQKALESIKRLNCDTSFLVSLVEYLTERKY
jgi:geranylgeranyl diphosphate synthase type II